MVESFTVKNYMSYRDQVELSFLASKKEKTSELPPEWYQEIDNKRILRLLLCVGLNGTGKTKMIEAVQYLRMLAISKPEKPTDKPAYLPFLLDDDSRYKPTELSLTYYIGTTCFYYYIKISERRIEEELLKQVTPNVPVYHRTYNEVSNTVTIKFGSTNVVNKAAQQALQLSVIQNCSVLSVFALLNLDCPVLKANYDYFVHHISMVRKSTSVRVADKLKTNNPERDQRVKTLLLQLLKDVGTNIVDFEVEDASMSITDLIKSGAPDFVIKTMQQQYPSGIISHKNLRFVHHTPNGNRSLDEGKESLGTINIVKLLLVMYDIVMSRKCSCIDEIEYAIHTKALEFLLKMYLTIADSCQFVVTTHDLSILKSKNLRRDAVRMFEKDDYGATTIKRMYVHSTMSYMNAYEKLLDEQLGVITHDFESFAKYKDLIQTFYDEFERRNRG